MSWVFDEVRGVSPVQRLVLLSIANHADKYGCNAWPSVATIAEEADVSRENTVRDALRALRDEGWIVVEVNQGGDDRVPKNRRPNRYSLPRMSGGAVGVDPSTSGGAVEVVRGGGWRASGGAVGGYQTIQNRPAKRGANAEVDHTEGTRIAAQLKYHEFTTPGEASPRSLEHIAEIKRARASVRAEVSE